MLKRQLRFCRCAMLFGFLFTHFWHLPGILYFLKHFHEPHSLKQLEQSYFLGTALSLVAMGFLALVKPQAATNR